MENLALIAVNLFNMMKSDVEYSTRRQVMVWPRNKSRARQKVRSHINDPLGCRLMVKETCKHAR